MDPRSLLKTGFTNVTQIDPQVLLEADPQTLLKIGFTSGTKFKNLIARTARLKPLNKTKQNYNKKTLEHLKIILLSISVH